MKLHYPPTERNREPILAVLRHVLPERGVMLEVAAGSGQHAVFFAAAFPQLWWHPTDIDPAALESIAAWAADSGLPNLAAPVRLDVTESRWPIESADAILCCNMVHIAPWEAAVGLIEGAGRVLASSGVLVLYGPYRVRGRPTAPSNEHFDESLKARDRRWGLRWVHEIEALATDGGLALEQTFDMPANNMTLVFRKG